MRLRCVLDRGPTGKRTTTTTTTQAAPTRRESLVFAPGRRNLAAECQRAKHITHIAEPRSKSQPARCVWNWNGRNITALLQHSSTHTHGKGKAKQGKPAFPITIVYTYSAREYHYYITQYSVVCEGMFFCFLMLCVRRTACITYMCMYSCRRVYLTNI